MTHRLRLQPGEAMVIAELRRRDMTAGQLSKLLLLSLDETSSLIARLVRAGHVVRRPYADDTRLHAISLSPQARSALDAIMDPLDREIDALGERLTPAERATLGRMLEAEVEVAERRADALAVAVLEGFA